MTLTFVVVSYFWGVIQNAAQLLGLDRLVALNQEHHFFTSLPRC